MRVKLFCGCVVRVVVVAFAIVLMRPPGAVAQLAEPPTKGRELLSAGREVIFAPPSNYSPTAEGGTDHLDLTDGKLVTRADQRIWLDTGAVAWDYGGRLSWALDLGEVQPIDEVAVRLQGGSFHSRGSLPGWVEVMASEDGKRYYRVGLYYEWNPETSLPFNVPEEAGEPWVHALRFENLGVRARWIGLRMYGSGLTVSDELYVFGPPPDASRQNYRSAAEVGEATTFAATRPQPHFHKPEIVLMTNAIGPVPVGVGLPVAPQVNRFAMELELPAGIELFARDGNVITGQAVDQTGKSIHRFEGNADSPRLRHETSPSGNVESSTAIWNHKSWQRLFMQATGWEDGQEGVLRYRVVYEDGLELPWVEKPLRAVALKTVQRPRHLLTTLGWYGTNDALRWPNMFESFDAIGFNGFSLFGTMTLQEAAGGNEAGVKLFHEARRRGFHIVHVDVPIHRMPRRPETRHQMADGSSSNQYCPSYRGPLWDNEVERVARDFRQIRPDFVAFDIEIWNWRGPDQSENCTRCQADFKASGLDDWDVWRREKGYELWTDLITAARRGAEEGGGARFVIGTYDWQPGEVYQHVWDFDRYYKEGLIDEGQVDTYTAYGPYHLKLMGDAARRSRQQLPATHQKPWITPGDAGTFPGEAFRWALLENYTNGSTGIYFWSQRLWDTESLIAYNEVIHGLLPVEHIIAKGDLVGDRAQVQGHGRVSGMQHEGEMVLLVADYFRRSDGRITLHLDLDASSRIRDLLTGEVVAESIGRGMHTIDLNGERARLLHIEPK